MRRWLVRIWVLVCVVLALVAGLLVGQRNGLICFSERSGGPQTVSLGPVTIGTDHSVYASSDTIFVTITNDLSSPITLTSPVAGCPAVRLTKLNY